MSRGLYFGARLGAGGPFGADTTSGSTSYSEGVGLLFHAGYAFIPYFGANLFLHWNHTSLAVEDGTGLSSNSGHVLVYGAELRGILPAGKFVGWGSLGLALGGGSLTLESQRDTFAGSVKNTSTGTVTVKPMPVLGFGAEYEVVDGLSVGPEVRWYLVSASEACMDSQTTGFTSNPKNCTQDFAKVAVPDFVFIGIGATYRLAL